MIADGLYDKLVNDLLADCLKSKKEVPNLKKCQKTLSNDDSTINTRSSNISTPYAIRLESEEEQPIANCNSKLEHSLAASSESANRSIITLTIEQIEKSTQHLLPYYKEGTRNKFALGFSGLSFKENIDEGSAHTILTILPLSS